MKFMLVEEGSVEFNKELRGHKVIIGTEGYFIPERLTLSFSDEIVKQNVVTIPFTGKKKTKKAQFVELYLSGASNKTIARVLKAEPHTVHNLKWAARKEGLI